MKIKRLNSTDEDLKKDYRYELKSCLDNVSFETLQNLVKLHPSNFREVYHERQINSIYLDDISGNSYTKNVDGFNERMKCRIRWYGDLYGVVAKPRLEFKIKKGPLGRKKIFDVGDFSFSRGFGHKDYLDLIKKSEIPADIKENCLKSFRPTILVRYLRKYFMSYDRNYRITIDRNLEYYLFNQLGSIKLSKTKSNSVIFEMKYEYAFAEDVKKLTRFFPFRIDKNSKYVNGIESFIGQKA